MFERKQNFDETWGDCTKARAARIKCEECAVLLGHLSYIAWVLPLHRVTCRYALTCCVFFGFYDSGGKRFWTFPTKRCGASRVNQWSSFSRFWWECSKPAIPWADSTSVWASADRRWQSASVDRSWNLGGKRNPKKISKKGSKKSGFLTKKNQCKQNWKKTALALGQTRFVWEQNLSQRMLGDPFPSGSNGYFVFAPSRPSSPCKKTFRPK